MQRRFWKTMLVRYSNRVPFMFPFCILVVCFILKFEKKREKNILDLPTTNNRFYGTKMVPNVTLCSNEVVFTFHIRISSKWTHHIIETTSTSTRQL